MVIGDVTGFGTCAPTAQYPYCCAFRMGTSDSPTVKVECFAPVREQEYIAHGRTKDIVWSMKPDLYTKFVLTVIAVSLVYLCIWHSFSTRVVSAAGEQPVVIAGFLNSDMGGAVTRLGRNGLPVAVTSPLWNESVRTFDMNSK